MLPCLHASMILSIYFQFPGFPKLYWKSSSAQLSLQSLPSLGTSWPHHWKWVGWFIRHCAYNITSICPLPLSSPTLRNQELRSSHILWIQAGTGPRSAKQDQWITQATVLGIFRPTFFFRVLHLNSYKQPGWNSEKKKKKKFWQRNFPKVKWNSLWYIHFIFISSFLTFVLWPQIETKLPESP